MRYLTRITMILVFTFWTVITLVHHPEAPPPVLLSLMFSNPDGRPCERPCLLGVQPGMTYKDVMTRVANHPFVQGFRRDRHGKEVEFVGQGIAVYVTPDEEETPKGFRTTSVGVSFPDAHSVDSQAGTEADNALRLGQVIDALGVPEVMEIVGDQVWLLYFHHQLMAAVSSKTRGSVRLTPTDPVMLAFTTDKQGFDPGGQIIPWHGFAILPGSTPPG